MASCPDPVVRNHAASRGRTGAGTRALRAPAVGGIVTVEPRGRAAPTRARRAAPEVTAAAHAARATDSGHSGFVRAVNPEVLDGGPREREFFVNWMKSLMDALYPEWKNKTAETDVSTVFSGAVDGFGRTAEMLGIGQQLMRADIGALWCKKSGPATKEPVTSENSRATATSKR